MGKGFVLRAVVVSAFVAFLVPFLYTVIFGYSVVYDPPMDPASFYDKFYEEQQQWLSENSKTLSGFQTLRARVSEGRFWAEYAELFGMSFFALLAACLSFGLWERKASRSNNSAQPTPYPRGCK